MEIVTVDQRRHLLVNAPLANEVLVFVGLAGAAEPLVCTVVEISNVPTDDAVVLHAAPGSQ
jgi:hypothetical protein